MNGNVQHMLERVNDRVRNPGDKAIVIKRLRGLLVRMVRRRDMPNCSWYAPVRDKKRIVAYICGQGCWFSTVLGQGMTPKGVKV